MSVIVNSDYEQRLFSSGQFSFESTLINQEFEYLYFFCGEGDELYTLKKYDNHYLDFVEDFTKQIPKLTSVKQDVSPWWGDSSQLQVKKFLQSKLNTTEFGIKNHLVHPLTKICSDVEDIGYELCKFPFSMSGRGHYRYPLNETKIKKLFNSSSCINEPNLKRCLDLSTFFNDGEIITTYQNEVDDFFQYKGTLIGKLSLKESLTSEYFKKLKLILKFIKDNDYTGVGSIDSFTYQENNKEHLYMLSEINTRKTMGHMAHLLFEKYSQDYKIGKMGIVKRKNQINHHEILKEFESKAFVLSPNDNRFHLYFIIGDNKIEIEDLEKLLLTRL